MLPPQEFFAEVRSAFGLGDPVSNPIPVSGGLSNRLYRLQTREGDFAIKRMVAHADAPDFKANVEASYRVEQMALTAGITMPQPVPVIATNEALASIKDGEGRSWVRVHQWIPARPIEDAALEPGDTAALAGMLATMHRIPAPPVHERAPTLPSRDWRTALPSRFASPDVLTSIAAMEDLVQEGYSTADPARVMSHRDLDQKNVLRTSDGRLMLVDWDAAGPVIAEWDVVTTALDWSGVREDAVSTEAFDRFLSAYAAGAPLNPIAASSFAGWCEGVLDWLWFNLGRATASDPIERQLGESEVTLSARFIPPAARWITSYT